MLRLNTKKMNDLELTDILMYELDRMKKFKDDEYKINIIKKRIKEWEILQHQDLLIKNK